MTQALFYEAVSRVLLGLDLLTGHRFYGLCVGNMRWFTKAHDVYFNGDRCNMDFCVECNKGCGCHDEYKCLNCQPDKRAEFLQA